MPVIKNNHALDAWMVFVCICCADERGAVHGFSQNRLFAIYDFSAYHGELRLDILDFHGIAGEDVGV